MKVAIAIIAFFLPLASIAETLTLSVSPPHPLPNEAVALIASGTLPQGPVYPFHVEVSPPLGQFSLHVVNVLFMGEVIGTTPFDIAIPLGDLPSGNYTLTYEQIAINPSVGLYIQYAPQVITFAVSAQAPAQSAEPVPTLSALSLSLLVVLLTIVAALRCVTTARNHAFNRSAIGGATRPPGGRLTWTR